MENDYWQYWQYITNLSRMLWVNQWTIKGWFYLSCSFCSLGISKRTSQHFPKFIRFSHTLEKISILWKQTFQVEERLRCLYFHFSDIWTLVLFYEEKCIMKKWNMLRARFFCTYAHVLSVFKMQFLSCVWSGSVWSNVTRVKMHIFSLECTKRNTKQ